MSVSAPDHLAISDAYRKSIYAGFASGKYEPLAISLYHLRGALLLGAYLLLPPSKSALVRWLRFPVWGIYTWTCIDTFLSTRTLSFFTAYTGGCAFVFAPIWTATFLVFRDVRSIARRVERRPKAGLTDESASAQSTSRQELSGQNGHIHERKQAQESHSAKDQGQPEQDFEYYWQSIPTDFRTRFGWILDLGLALRGTGWSHQGNTISGPPADIATNLDPPPTAKPSSSSPSTAAAVIRRESWVFLTRYIGLDIIRVYASYDPYLMTLGSRHPLPLSFPHLLATSPFLLRLIRLLAPYLAVRFGLEIVYSSYAILCVGILGPRVLGFHASPFLYPHFYGPLSLVATKGLKGFWGAHWHQMLRLGLEASGWALVRAAGWKERAPQSRFVVVAFAFVLSGCIHTGASYRTPGPSNGVGSFVFFLLQIVGLVGETVLVEGFKRTGVRDNTPKWLRRVVTMVAVMAWLLWTGTFFSDDVARGGLLLIEPVPISFVRALGFGGSDRGTWRWWAHNVFWYRDKQYWYKSGWTF